MRKDSTKAQSCLPVDSDAAAARELRSAFFQNTGNLRHGLPGLDVVRTRLTVENLFICLSTTW